MRRWPADPHAQARYRQTSNLNVERANATVANLVVAEVGPSGPVCLYSSDGTHLVADELGWWTGESLDTTGAPVRLLDTRRAGSKPAAGSTTVVATGTPAAGVVLNVTVTSATGPGFVTVWPCGQERPWSSNLNIDRTHQTAAAGVAT